MVRSRTLTAAAGLIGSLAISVLLWWYFDTLAVFLFVPFVPFLLRGRGEQAEAPPVRECPRCGFQTMDAEFEYCPRDGSRLEFRRQ